MKLVIFADSSKQNFFVSSRKNHRTCRGQKQIEVDTRVLAATNRNLEEAMKKCNFPGRFILSSKRHKYFSSDIAGKKCGCRPLG